MCDNLTGVCTCGLAGHSHHHHGHDGGHAPFHRLFGELHETYESEFGSISPSTPDDDGTAAARRTATENPTAENLLALAGALCFQLRYKEAAEVYDKILAGAPSNYAANRKLALCMLKTRNFGKARELLAVCDRLNPASLDVIYRQGLCEFYDGNFERAEEYFLNCYPLTRDNGDMYIAVIYWHLLTLVRLGKDTAAALAEYSSDIQIGHHVGYLLTCKLFAGEDTLAHLTESTEDQVDSFIATIAQENMLGRHLLYLGKFRFQFPLHRVGIAVVRQVVRILVRIEKYRCRYTFIFITCRRIRFQTPDIRPSKFF